MNTEKSVNRIFHSSWYWCAIILVTSFSIMILLSPTAVSQAAISASAYAWSDEFDQPQLNIDWNWQNENPSNWSLSASPGNLQIISTEGDWVDACGPDAENVLLMQPSFQDFVITTKVDFNANNNYQQAGIVLFEDNYNRLKLVTAYNDQLFSGQIVEFILVENGERLFRFQSPVDLSQPIYLKLEKLGDIYTGHYSYDNVNFETLPLITTSGLELANAGLYAFNSCYFNVPDIPAKFDYFRIDAFMGRIVSPADNITIGPSTVLFSAEVSSTMPSGIKNVEFLVFYDGVWHSAGLDAIPPYEVNWQTPAQLRSQQLLFGIHVTDNDNVTQFYAGDIHRVNFVESLGNPEVEENWVPTRAYLNQRALFPEGDSKCSAASMAMVLAMNGLINIDFSSMSETANEIYPRVLNGNGDAYIGAMAAELRRQGMNATANPYLVDNAWLTLKQEIDAGRPVIVRTAHGVVTSAGHYFVAVGYRETVSSRDIITYDPFGRWLGSCCTNNYDLNSADPESHKGQWVYYNFDTIFGDYNWLLIAQPDTNVNRLSASNGVPTTPPDKVSDEPQNIGTYLGINAIVGSNTYLPFVTR